MYILEPMADLITAEFGIEVHRNSYRKGSVRFKDLKGEANWLFYQNKSAGTVNISYSLVPDADSIRKLDAMAVRLRSAGLPADHEIERGKDGGRGREFVRAHIPGFVSDDDTNWEELRDQLISCFRAFFSAVEATD